MSVREPTAEHRRVLERDVAGRAGVLQLAGEDVADFVATRQAADDLPFQADVDSPVGDVQLVGRAAGALDGVWSINSAEHVMLVVEGLQRPAATDSRSNRSGVRPW